MSATDRITKLAEYISSIEFWEGREISLEFAEPIAKALLTDEGLRAHGLSNELVDKIHLHFANRDEVEEEAEVRKNLLRSQRETERSEAILAATAAAIAEVDAKYSRFNLDDEDESAKV